MTPKMICFDMDGTIANLYGVNGWKEMLDARRTTPYAVAKPMCDMRELATICKTLHASGIEIRVVTWLSKNSTKAYEKAVTETKIAWLKKHHFPYDKVHAISYGTSKRETILPYLKGNETAWIFDDDARVRADWNIGKAIDPTICDILDTLRSLI